MDESKFIVNNIKQLTFEYKEIESLGIPYAVENLRLDVRIQPNYVEKMRIDMFLHVRFELENEGKKISLLHTDFNIQFDIVSKRIIKKDTEGYLVKKSVFEQMLFALFFMAQGYLLNQTKGDILQEFIYLIKSPKNYLEEHPNRKKGYILISGGN